MKTFPIKISFKEDENNRQNELIRAEIKFISEISIERKYLPEMEKSAQNRLAERLQRQIYGSIKDALFEAEHGLRMEQHINPCKIAAIFHSLRNSIPKLTHD